MGLSRNKVAVPEGAAGTPPFWSGFRALRRASLFFSESFSVAWFRRRIVTLGD